MRRLQVVAETAPENQMRTIERIRRAQAVEAEGSVWGQFLSALNKSVASKREAIVEAYENQELEAIVDILSDAMQDLLDNLADEFGYAQEGEEGDDDGEGEGEPDDAQFDEEPAAGSEFGAAQTRSPDPVTVIE